MTSDRPIHTDRYRSPLIQLLTPTVAGVFLGWGILQSDGLLLVLGLSLGLFIWYTKHSRYTLYEDKLEVRYGGPRRKVVPTSQIESAQMVRLPMNGESILLRRSAGQPLLLRPSQPEEFLSHLLKVIGSETPTSPAP